MTETIKNSLPAFDLIRQHQKVAAVFPCDRLVASRYTLQRSLDRLSYDTVAIYHPFSGSPDLVTMVDESAPSGNCYYRLKMLDKDGNTHACVQPISPADSAELTVSVKNEEGHTPLLRFDIRNIPAPCDMLVVVYDGLGREITSFGRKMKKAGSFVMQEDLAGSLISGVYKVVTAFTDAIFTTTVLVNT